MKRIIYILLISTFCFVGCNEDEFLEEINPNAIIVDIFWQTETQFMDALTTVYGALQFHSISGGFLIYEMVLGDIAGTENWSRSSTFRKLSTNDATYHITDKWEELYVGIFRANQLIQYIQIADPAIFNEYNKQQIEAQARFLRAWFYWQLAHTYGGAVMHTLVIENDADFDKPFSSIEEVNTNIIVPDLEFVIQHLPQTWDDANNGRITWGAATSLLGKVYLYNKNWTSAAEMFKQVIESGIYNLVSDVRHNYSEENELNEESIFEVVYSAELNPGIGGSRVDDNNDQSGAEASTLARAFGQRNFGGFNTLLPSYFLHELFVFDEVDNDNPINNGNTQSKRMSASICPLNGETNYYTLPIGDRTGWAFGQSAYIKKHTNWYHLQAEDGQARSGINFRHIRLADVYLMYAEAVIEAYGDVKTAVEFVDEIRTRAGVITLSKYMEDNNDKIPELHKSAQIYDAHKFVDATPQSIMKHIRRVERPLELCFEGHRWKDLVRWGIVQEVFNELLIDENWRFEQEAILNLDNLGIPPIYIVERIRPDFSLAAQNYNSSVHDYFPIPAQERQLNNMIN